MRRAALPLVLAGLVACSDDLAPARDQWIVTLSTNAPVPRFGDKLYVEILGSDGQPACADCTRTFGVGSTSDWPVAFGIVPSGSHARYIRASLFHGMALSGSVGADASDTAITAIGALPSPDGVTQANLVLQAQCFGLPSDLAAGVTCQDGEVGPIKTLGASEPAVVGSWPPAAEVPCASQPPPGMKCIPGGAFLMGGHGAPMTVPELYPLPEHVVLLSPFFLDEDELTVGQVRSLVDSGFDMAPAAYNDDPNTVYHACTWLADSPAHDALPVNCVTWQLASAVCKALGKRLPTEAEWEYAAGDAALELSFPWGSDLDICKHAVTGRGRTDLNAAIFEDVTCELSSGGATALSGPVARGSDGDVTQLGIRNLGGNVSEWVEDYFAPYGSVCWPSTGGVVLVDPVCGSGALRSGRGSAWNDLPAGAHAYTRGALSPFEVAPSNGVRCAK